MSNKNREWYKAHHICPRCGANDAFGRYVHCAECLEEISFYNQKYKHKRQEYEARHNDKRKQQYGARKQAGLCTKCGKRDAIKGLLCLECWLKQRKRREKEKVGRKRPGETFRERIAARVCMYCEAPVVPGYCFCEKCLAKVRANTDKGRAKASARWRKEITAGWELAKFIHRKKRGME